MRGLDKRQWLLALTLAASMTACGEDNPPPPPAARTAARAPARAAPSKATGANQTVAYRRVEEVVTSEAEKKAIRHRFNERDFAPDVTGTENRDPFRSFVITQPGIGAATGLPAEATDQCPRTRQFGRGFSARELKLVGIVARGTIRYALFSDSSQRGYVIRTGDCVGKEKARVKEIGAGFVTLEISAEQPPNQAPRPAEQRSIQLHPKDLPVGETDDQESDDGAAPADLRRRSDEILRGDGRTTPAPLPTGPATPPPAPPRPTPTTPTTP